MVQVLRLGLMAQGTKDNTSKVKNKVKAYSLGLMAPLIRVPLTKITSRATVSTSGLMAVSTPEPG